MIAAAVLSFAITVALTPAVIVLLRRVDAYDVPTERSSHVDRTLRGGGLAVAIGAVAGMVLGNAGEASSLTTLLVAVSILAVVGLIDDLRTLEVFPRLGAQLFGAVLCLPWLLTNLSVPWGWRLLLAVGAVIWVMGFVNAFNFMDGINGISGLCTIVAGASFLIVGRVEDLTLVQLSGVVIMAAALGFLPYNLPRARVFLGDVGSYFLGGWLAFTVLVMLVSDVPPEAAFGAVVIYLADTTYTLVRRVVRGANWWESHHEHIYQQLIDRGWSHTATACEVAGFSAICGALGLVSLTGSVGGRVLADTAMVVVALAYLAVPAVLSRRDRRVVAAPGAQRTRSLGTITRAPGRAS